MKQSEYPRLEEMLKCGCPFNGEMRDKAIQSIRHYAIQELIGTLESDYTDQELLELICNGMENYLVAYKTRPIFKNHLKSKLESWVKMIESSYNLPESAAVDLWPDYVTKDVGIDLVKALHNQTGSTKEALREAVSAQHKKTIQNGLRKLDPKLNESNGSVDTVPFRIGGHEMHVDIKCVPIPGTRGERSYYTPNTLHPLVMQLNVTQTAAMLMALQTAYDRCEYGTYCEDVALDIWCQLSEYCKERIRLVFTQNNADFGSFLDSLDQMLDDGRYPIFKTERMMAEGAPYDVQLDYASKTSRLCNLTLRIDDADISLQKKRIFKNHRDSWYCNISGDETSDKSRIIFTVNDVKTIEFA